jgi:hypothetical protein
VRAWPTTSVFIEAEGEVLGERVGSWFKYFFWFIGAFSLFAAALGIVDYISRLAADVLKTSYTRNANESKMYAGLVWGLIAVGNIVLLVDFDQPIVLLVIAAVVGGFMMFIYSGLLILINRRTLPAPIRIRGFRLVMLIWAIVLFGTLSLLTFQAQIARLLAAADPPIALSPSTGQPLLRPAQPAAARLRIAEPANPPGTGAASAAGVASWRPPASASDRRRHPWSPVGRRPAGRSCSRDPVRPTTLRPGPGRRPRPAPSR